MNPWEINAKSVLVIPDIHQDLDFALTAINREKGKYDHILFLGDFYDTRFSFPQVKTKKDTATFVKDVARGIYGPNTLLLGNHDASYMESWSVNQRFSNKRELVNKQTGFSKNGSIDINKIMSSQDWSKFNLFATFGGFLFSHAGFNPYFWNSLYTTEENLLALWTHSKEALSAIFGPVPHRLFGCGKARGGQYTVGGPTWQDWEDEFVDDVIMPPQIVGHTQSYNSVKQKGRSYCIDGAQHTYIIINQKGDFDVKTTHSSNSWHYINSSYPQYTKVLN